MHLYFVEEALNRGDYPVALLNAFMTRYGQWNRQTANKDHTDEFGDLVKRGEHYYSRQIGGGFGDVSKVSAGSMEKVLRIVFQANGAGLGLAKELLKEKDDAMLDVARRMSAHRAQSGILAP